MSSIVGIEFCKIDSNGRLKLPVALKKQLITSDDTRFVLSFLEYFSQYLSLAGMERITGVNQKQLSNYLNRRSKPRKQQIERISKGLRRFASELLSMTL